MNVKERLNNMKKKLVLGGLITLSVTGAKGQSVAENFASFKEKSKKEFSDFSKQNNIDVKSNADSENTEWKTTKEGIKYALTPDGVKFQASIGLSTHHLMPKIYEIDDDGNGKRVFECGGTFNSNKAVLNKVVSEKIKKVIIFNKIIEDIKESCGKDIPLQAANLMNNTEKNMQKLGLVEKDGKYFQINPDVMQIGGHVKDKSSLEKQKEKDIKDAAKDIQKQMNSKQNNFNRLAIRGNER